MFDIRQVDSPIEKEHICDTILHALPNWFSIETSIVDYMRKTQSMPFWAAFDGEKPIGFVALRIHNVYTSEVCVMGVLKDYHRRSVGKRLIACCEAFCSDHGTEYLTVKTVDASSSSESYARTRKFYMTMGFRPLEVFPLHWDKDNPCLLMAKYLPATI